MRLKGIVLFCALITLTGCGKKPVTLSTLLNEMTNREVFIELPEYAFTTHQTSSYNRESKNIDSLGWFADSDGSGYIRTEPNKTGGQQWVIMEDDGPGAIVRLWAACLGKDSSMTTGGNISIFLDGNEEPVIHTNLFALVQGTDFVKAPFANASPNAGTLYLPIPYAKGCKVVMDCEPHYNSITYRSYDKEVSVESFSMERFQQNQLLLNRTAACLQDQTAPDSLQLIEYYDVNIRSNRKATFDLPEGNHAVYYLSLKLDSASVTPDALRKSILMATFDSTNTIWCSFSDFFAIPDGIRPYEMWDRSVSQDGRLTCRWIMPFRKDGHFEILNLSDKRIKFDISIGVSPRPWSENSLYFYAGWYHRTATPTFPLEDLPVLRISGKGYLVGDNLSVLTATPGWWGEGDEKIFINQDIPKKNPTFSGTGTGHYYGWAQGKETPGVKDQFSTPFTANIQVGEQCVGYNSNARSRMLDAIPFDQLVFNMEVASRVREYWNHMVYDMTFFWYAEKQSNASLVINTDRQVIFERIIQDRISDLDKLSDINTAAATKPYIIPLAVEAENVSEITLSQGASLHAQAPQVWGSFSAGAAKGVSMSHAGDFAEFLVPSSNSSSKIRLCAAVGPEMGSFDIFVNGIRSRLDIDLHSSNSGVVTPLLDLGYFTPNKDGLYHIKFIAKRPGDLVVDYFHLEELKPDQTEAPSPK